MSRYTVFDLQRDCKRKLPTSSPSASLDFYGAMLDAKRNMTKEVAPPEMVRTSYLEQALFDEVDKYAVPDDLNYNDVIDIKKLASYRDKNVDTMDHEFQMVYRKRYNQKRPGSKNVMTVGYTNGIKTASIDHPTGLRSQKVLIHDCDSLDKNGTWNFGGNVVNLVVDELNHVQGKGALKFNFNDTDTQGFIENATLHPVDLSNYLERGSIFSSLFVSLPKKLITVRTRLYSSPDDYYEYTVNRPHNASAFQTGWNILKSIFSNQYIVGNPNPKDINKIRYDFVTNGEQINDMALDAIFARTGEVYEATYQSSYCIVDPVTGEWKLRADSGNDILPFEDDTYGIYLLETVIALKKELQANNSAGAIDYQSNELELKALYDDYKMNHKSEVVEDSQYMYTNGDYMNGYQDDIIDFYGQNDTDGDYYKNN